MHPLLQRLQARTVSLDALDAALRDASGPLRTDLADGAAELTFVWIGEAPSVSLHCGLASPNGPVAMTRLGDLPVFTHTVRAPTDTLVSYRYVVDDPFLTADIADDTQWQRLMLEAQQRSFADPYNPARILPLAALFGLPVRHEQQECIVALPDAPVADWFEPHDAPCGELTSFTHTSAAMGTSRTITVHVPAGATSHHPLVVLLDGTSYLTIAGLPRALDRANQRGEFAPAVVAFVHPADGSTGLADRVVELSCNPQHAAMLATELIPELRRRLPVSPDADRTVLGGASLGGLASAYTAIEHPLVVRNVLSVSGSFWYGTERDGSPEWLTRQLQTQPSPSLRWYQQIGRLEDGPLALSPGVSHLQANRNLAAVLRAQAAHHTYDELGTAHDICAFRVATMRGLTALLGTAP